MKKHKPHHNSQGQKGNHTNRCFGEAQPPPKPEKREEKIKELLTEAQRKRRAERELTSILRQFGGKKSLLQLLPVIWKRFSREVLLLAIERIERRQDDLQIDDRIFFEGFKKELAQHGQ